MWKILLGLLLLTCAGCAGPSEPPPTSIAPIDSAKVQAAVQNIKTDAELAGCVIKVNAQNDLLVMSGEVNSEQAKARAEVLVRKVKGINKVANHLMVQPNKQLAPGDAAPPP